MAKNEIVLLAFIGEVVVDDKFGKQIKGKARKSLAQVFRFCLEGLGENYEELMGIAIDNKELVAQYLKSLRK